MSCGVYTKSFINDIDYESGYNLDLDFLLYQIRKDYNREIGVWTPIFIEPYSSSDLVINNELLKQVDTSYAKAFDPCNCNDSQIIGDDTSYLSSAFESDIDTSYCGNRSVEWFLYDNQNNKSPISFTADCSNGACDVASKNDDFLPKVPVLNQIYLSKFYDFKWLNQFPAMTNPGIGKARVFSTNNFKQLKSNESPFFCIDWNIHPTISEIEYDSVTSHHTNKSRHDKSYARSQITSKTCGNFLFLSLPNPQSAYQTYAKGSPILNDYATTGTLDPNRTIDIPSKEDFTKPYGWKDRTYDNIFVGKDKVGSYWKWNINKAVLCWYRYYDVDRENDTRPIPGVDLYISPGDVFWAQNDGPERSPTDIDITGSLSEIQMCPSGLKLVDGLNITAIIPDKSSFVYISENIYSRFHDLYEIYRNDFNFPDAVAFDKASVLCTAPLYDGFTTDLLDIEEAKKYYRGSFSYNDFEQVDVLNRLMSKGTYYDSANGLNFISNTVELVNTLYDKYGGYVWIPPNTDNELKFDLAESSKSMLVDMDFDCVPNAIPPAWTNTRAKNSCETIKQPKYNYSYEQKFSFGDMTFVSFLDQVPRYEQTCRTFSKPSGTGVMYYNQLVDHNHTLYGGTALNNNVIDSYPIYSGFTQFYDIYPRISTSGGNRGYCSDCGPYSSWALADAIDQLCDPPAVSAASIGLSLDIPTPTPSPLSEELRILETSYSPPETSAPPAEEDETFCMFSLARAYNKIDSGDREPRIIADNTHYFYRNYSALCHNPHISTVAFHQNGGIFYDSVYSENKTIFDRNLASFDVNGNRLGVSFRTMNVGIKIYDIKLRKLQSNERGTETCERFPIDTENTCKCYGLNLNRFSKHPKGCTDTNTQWYGSSTLYIPGLSTRCSPAIEYYGGYSDSELFTLFGVEGHTRPPTEYGGSPNILPILPQMRDPENPYNCNKYASITLTNYTKSSYDLTLNNFSTKHADVLLTVHENADLTGGPITFSQDEEGNDTSSTNIYWKRFLTKVVANGVTVYNQQKHVVIPSTTNIAKNYTFNVTLTNPYLVALIGSDAQLAFPTGDPYEQGILIGSSRGDETSVVTLTFQQRPRKQLLNFRMAAYKEEGYAKTSFWDESTSALFYPNLGLGAGFLDDFGEYQSGGIDKRGYINYYSGKPSHVQWSYLTKRNNDVIDKVSNFSRHRKFRIYRGGEVNGINSAYIPNRGGYKLKDIDYIGAPHLFEYAKSSQNITSSLIPAIPKKSVYLDYILRENPYIKYFGAAGAYQKILNEPYADIGYEEDEFIYDSNNLRILKIPGTREYFRTAQRNRIWTVNADDTIESIINGLKLVNAVGTETETTDPETGETTTNPPEHAIKTFDLIQRTSMLGYYYAFMGGDPEQTYNYLYIGTNSDIFFLRSSLDIDYNNVAKNGYVYNTGKPCEEEVEIIYQGTRKDIATKNLITYKTLYVEFYNNRGQRIRYDDPENKYYKTYTILTFRDKVTPPNNEEKIKAIHRQNKTSLLLYNNVLNMRESDPLLNNSAYQTKWGDLIRYDGDFLNNPHIIEYHRNDTPSTPYHNLFFKQIVNNYDEDFYFHLQKGYRVSEDIALNSSSLSPYFNILQKYDIERDKPWAPPSEQYENYLPIMEVSYPDSTSFDQDELKGSFTSSALYNSYINEDLPEWAIDPDIYPIFFHNANIFETAFHPPEVFYNQTLRVDDPAFVLEKTIRKDQTSNRPDARKIFKPGNMNTIVNAVTGLIPWTTKKINRSHPFYLKSAYADLDSSGPCYPKKCSMATAGYIGLYSQFASAVPAPPIDMSRNLTLGSSRMLLSYDAGLYNPIGDNRYISIQRTELNYSNPFDSEITCSTSQPLPAIANQTFSTSYQKHIDENFFNYNVSLSPLDPDERNVAIMDRHANEMLFRTYYGEKQKINRKQAYIDKEPLTLEDLVGYTDPKITPRYLYDEILYNYDQNTKQNITFNGSLQIYGTKEPGDNINMSVAGVGINLSLQMDPEGSLMIYGKVGEHTVSQKIYDRILVLKRLITTDYYVSDPGPPGYSGENGEENRASPNTPPPDPQSTSDNQTIKLIASHTYEGSAGWTTDITPNYDFPDTGMSSFGNGTTGVGANLAVVYREKPPETFPCHYGSKEYDPYINGYCSIDDDPKGEGCDICDNFEGIDVRVFDYSFEQCSVRFDLKGHSFRKKYSGPDNEDPIEEENQNPNYVAPVGESTETAELIEDTSDDCNPPVEDCAVFAIGYGCWVEKCYSYWQNPYTCRKRKIPSSNRLIRKVFVSESRSDIGEYHAPACPEYFIGISYNNKSVTVSIPKARASQYVTPEMSYVSQNTEYIDFCVPINVTYGCPDLWVSSIPTKYNIVESIDSSCEGCPQDTSVELTDHKNDYEYDDFTAVCEVGRMTYGDLHGSPIVTVGIRADDGRDDFGRSLPPCYGNIGSLVALCDGGLPWTSCVNGAVLKSGKNVQNKCGTNTADDPSIIECDGGIGVDRGWLAQENFDLWKENIQKQFDKSFLSPSGPSAFAGALHDAFVRPEIPTTDIIKGVIPGSAKLNFETQGVDIPKFRPRPDGGVEESTWTVYTTIAYITYTYRAPKTLNVFQNKDIAEGGIIKEYDNNNVLIGIKTDNALENCTFNPFPESYYAYSNLGNPVRLNPTYLTIKADLNKGSCTSGFEYYDKYSKQQTICNKNDWLCWAAMDYRNTKAFLSRMFDENWM